MEPPKNVLKQNWNEREGKWYLMKRAPKIWRCPFSPIKSAYVTLLGHHKCAFFLPFYSHFWFHKGALGGTFVPVGFTTRLPQITECSCAFWFLSVLYWSQNVDQSESIFN
jgi:hypothetical protein